MDRAAAAVADSASAILPGSWHVKVDLDAMHRRANLALVPVKRALAWIPALPLEHPLAAAVAIGTVALLLWPAAFLPATVFALAVVLAATALLVAMDPGSDTESDSDSESEYHSAGVSDDDLRPLVSAASRGAHHDDQESMMSPSSAPRVSTAHEPKGTNATTTTTHRRRNQRTRRRRWGDDAATHHHAGVHVPHAAGKSTTPLPTLDLDHGGALDTVIATVRNNVLRDFVDTWYLPTVAAPGPDADRAVFPHAVASTIDAVVMNAAASLTARAPQELLVAVASRASGDLVALLKAFHGWYDEVEPTLANPLADVAGALDAHLAANPHSVLARAADPMRHAVALRSIARRLLHAWLPDHDASCPLVVAMLVELLCSAALWPAVRQAAAPHFINHMLLSALTAPAGGAAGQGAPAQAQEVITDELNARVIQTKGHANVLTDLDPSEMRITVSFQDHAETVAPVVNGTSNASYIFDASLSFPWRTVGIPTPPVVTLHLGRSHTTDHDQIALEPLGAVSVTLDELPHVGWVTFTPINGGNEPVADLWLELERVPAPVIAVPDITVETAAAASPALPQRTGSTAPPSAELQPVAYTEPVPPLVAHAAEADDARSPDDLDLVLVGHDEDGGGALVDDPVHIDHDSLASTPSDRLSLASLSPLQPATRALSPPPPLPALPRTWAALEAHGGALLADFHAYLDATKQTRLVAFLQATASYKLLTDLLDPADPSSRALLQQEGFDTVDAYLTGKHAVLPVEPWTRDVEQALVADPDATVFDAAAAEVQRILDARVAAYVAGQETRRQAAANEDAAVAALLSGVARVTRPRAPRRRRAQSVSVDDRPALHAVLADVDPVAALAARHAALLAVDHGPAAMGDAHFVASSMVTFQTQYLVLETMLRHAMAVDDDDAVSRLMTQRSQVECALVALEEWVRGDHRPAKPAQSAAKLPPPPPSPSTPFAETVVREGHQVAASLSGIASSASALTANVGKGMRSAFKGFGEKRSAFGSAWTNRGSQLKRKVSSLSMSSNATTLVPAHLPPMPSFGRKSRAASAEEGEDGQKVPTAGSDKTVSLRRKSSASTLASTLTLALPNLPALPSAPAAGGAGGASKLVRRASRLGSFKRRSGKNGENGAANGGNGGSDEHVRQDAESIKEPAAGSSPRTTTRSRSPALSATTAPPPSTAASVALSPRETDALLEAAFSVVKHVFGLDGTLRARLFAVLRPVLRPVLASHIQASVGTVIDQLSSPTFLAHALQASVVDVLWPGGIWHTRAPGHERHKPHDVEDPAVVLAALEVAMPDAVGHLLGKHAAAAGLRATLALVQVDALNRGLVVQVLASLVDEVLGPETTGGDVGQGHAQGPALAQTQGQAQQQAGQYQHQMGAVATPAMAYEGQAVAAE
ncbi:hypothetical protein AMAG_05478 [Allomyces macrogynus ATCC 38327]|uniref:PXA domain-containing protein n=1 Tax=Allomyces macrogynus (strain ATCC 38327) TaxID=578462 RepID=A0A0L0SC28_ALLM3|nr:hypothetical protein AMAG_05478 [Allomyces macrogynus ATCC 38327]|eukprot:KNE60041.1 hypothetical protein AMAG_05478 [Allomyces macrogynus ATCC 38327]